MGNLVKRIEIIRLKHCGCAIVVECHSLTKFELLAESDLSVKVALLMANELRSQTSLYGRQCDRLDVSRRRWLPLVTVGSHGY